MKLSWHIQQDDVQRLRGIYESQRNNSFVVNRIRRNVQGNFPQVTKEIFWQTHVAALLTTQQRSGPHSPVSRLLSTRPFPLGLDRCSETDGVRDLIQQAISDFGGIRRGPTIARECETNIRWLNNGGWQQCLHQIEGLVNNERPAIERRVAEFIDKHLVGFGPKQSRNFLQALGLTKYEIPIDSRITKWLNKNGFPITLTAKQLSDSHYYNFVMDGIITLCAEADILPCVMDATIFSSYDPAWPADQLVW